MSVRAVNQSLNKAPGLLHAHYLFSQSQRRQRENHPSTSGVFHERGCKVLLVDSDLQGSASDWDAARENNPIPLIAYGKPENLKPAWSGRALRLWRLLTAPPSWKP